LRSKPAKQREVERRAVMEGDGLLGFCGLKYFTVKVVGIEVSTQALSGDTT
jgi:hypothetical protein